MSEIKLFELGPTRSARVRWILLEAGLPYESIGNDPSIIGSEALRRIHPLGKLPAAVIDGRPLFESAAIVSAIADLVPEKRLIAPPGSWSRSLHDQWVMFALTELEPWLSSTEINSMDFVLSPKEHVKEIIPQNNRMFARSAAALDSALGNQDYLVDNRFSATDVVVGYTLNWAEEQHLLADHSNLVTYLDRLYEREYCTLTKH